VTGVTGDACVEPVDPWCSDVYNPNQPQKLFIAIRYKEVMTRPVRVQPYGCGCDDSRCEYSRWRDGYEIGVLTACPCLPIDTPPWFTDVPTRSTPVCPCAPETPWVGLAEVDMDGDGIITGINNCSCRRLVVSFGNFWWSCMGEQDIKITPNVTMATIARGKSGKLQYSGTNLQMSATPDLGADIAISGLSVDTTKGTIAFTATPAWSAEPTTRTLIIRNGDCTWGTLPGALNVIPAATAATNKTTPAKKNVADKTTGSTGG
jgi:hypothetical protein